MCDVWAVPFGIFLVFFEEMGMIIAVEELILGPCVCHHHQGDTRKGTDTRMVGTRKEGHTLAQTTNTGTTNTAHNSKTGTRRRHEVEMEQMHTTPQRVTHTPAHLHATYSSKHGHTRRQ